MRSTPSPVGGLHPSPPKIGATPPPPDSGILFCWRYYIREAQIVRKICPKILILFRPKSTCSNFQWIKSRPFELTHWEVKSQKRVTYPKTDTTTKTQHHHPPLWIRWWCPHRKAKSENCQCPIVTIAPINRPKVRHHHQPGIAIFYLSVLSTLI